MGCQRAPPQLTPGVVVNLEAWHILLSVDIHMGEPISLLSPPPLDVLVSHIVKAMVFPVVTYGCESWTIKKAEHQRIDALELWCWRRLLRVPWTSGRFNQSILKEIFIGRTDAKAEAAILWPPDVKN